MSYLNEMAKSGYNIQSIDSFHKEMIPYLVETLAGAEHEDLIVDIGAGQGHGLIPLMERGYQRLVAVDMEEENFPIFEKYGIKCYRCDVEHDSLPLANDTVNVILSIHLIEHLDAPDQFMRECFRLLVPGGHIFIVTPDWRKQVKTFWRDPTHRHPYDRVSIARLLRIHDFDNEKTYPWNSRYGFGRLHAFKLFPMLGMIGKDLLAHARKPKR